MVNPADSVRVDRAPQTQPQSALSGEALALAGTIGFPPELGDPSTLFVARRGDVAGFVRQNGFTTDSSLGTAVLDAAKVMSPAGSTVVFDLSRLAGQPIEVRARAWSALARMTETLRGGETPSTPAVAAEPPARRGAPANPRPVLREPGAGALPAGGNWQQHPQIQGTSVVFREWFANPGNQRLTFDLLLGRQPKSVTAGLDEVRSRYEDANSNIQQVVSRLQVGLQPFGYQGQLEGVPNRAMLAPLAFARESAGSQFTSTMTRAQAEARAAEMRLDNRSLLTAIAPGHFHFRVRDAAERLGG